MGDPKRQPDFDLAFFWGGPFFAVLAKRGSLASDFALLIFPDIHTAMSNELASARPFKILQLPPAPFECQFSNSEGY